VPRIPQYQSQKKITPQATGPRVNPELLSRTGRNIQDFGEHVLQVDEAVRQVRDLKQTTEATTWANQEIAKVQQEALRDPNLFDNQEKYYARLKEISAEGGKGIIDTNARLKFHGNLSTQVTQIQFQLGSQARTNLVKSTTRALEEGLNANRQAYANAPTLAARQQIMMDSDTMILEAHEKGILTPEKRDQILKEQHLSFNKAHFDYLKQTDPRQALELARSGKLFEKAEDNEQAEKDALQAIKKLNVVGREMLIKDQEATEIRTGKAILTGQMDQASLDILEANDRLIPGFYEAMNRNINSPYAETATTDDSVFAELYLEAASVLSKNITNPKTGEKTSKSTKKQRAKARALVPKIFDANSSNTLSKIHATQLFSMVEVEFQDHANGWRLASNMFEDVVDFAQDSSTSAKNRNFITAMGIMPAAIRSFAKHAGWGQDEEATAMRRVTTQVIDEFNEGKIQAGEINTRRNAILKEIAGERHPEATLRDDVANGVASSTKGMRAVHPGSTTLKPDAKVTPPAPKGMVNLRAPDGRLLQVPESKVEELKTAGAIEEGSGG